jgi:hypothetical protein
MRDWSVTRWVLLWLGFNHLVTVLLLFVLVVAVVIAAVIVIAERQDSSAARVCWRSL